MKLVRAPFPEAPTTSPSHRDRALADAIDTIVRGAGFLHGRALLLERRGTAPLSHHAMVLANALRELDCFLHALLDALAACSGVRGDRLRSFRRRRNAAAKLAAYPALFGGHPEDRTRLDVLAKQRTTLLTLAGRGRSPTAPLSPMSGMAPLPAINLRSISAYYANLAARIIRHARPDEMARLSPLDDHAALPAPSRQRVRS